MNTKKLYDQQQLYLQSEALHMLKAEHQFVHIYQLPCLSSFLATIPKDDTGMLTLPEPFLSSQCPWLHCSSVGNGSPSVMASFPRPQAPKTQSNTNLGYGYKGTLWMC